MRMSSSIAHRPEGFCEQPAMYRRPGKPINTKDEAEEEEEEEEEGSSRSSYRRRCFYMPLHYPRYTEADYHTMPEWKLDRLLRDYGIPAAGDLADKRRFAIGAFLWP